MGNRKTMMVRVPEALYEEIKELAIREDRTVQAEMARAIRLYLERRDRLDERAEKKAAAVAAV